MRFTLLLFCHRKITLLAIAFVLGLSTRVAISQVSPNEILNPDLKALEQIYFRELIAINQSVAKARFPFPVYLSRYVGLDPAKQAEADSRGLEFVRFQEHTILKITGNYNAAYNALSMTRNDRAAATFRSVVLPILTFVTIALPEDLACDGIGFEISHHARTNNGSYDYEGKEILVVVFGRSDAWAMSRAATDAQRQEILNRNKIYLNGSDYGLSLTEHDPLNVEALPRSTPAKPDATSTARSAVMASHSSLMSVKSGSFQVAHAQTPIEAPVPQADASPAVPKAVEPPPATPVSTQADADWMDEKYQTQLAALHKEGTTKFHFVAYAPPTFVLFHDTLTLQMTLKNSLQFDPARSSIYKRAAQSFDLFLAPLLKDLSARISPDVEFQLFDFSVLNRLSPGAKESSEALEFICPRAAVKQFINAEITNQQLLDQSIILVNGVRIALNLQIVE